MIAVSANPAFTVWINTMIYQQVVANKSSRLTFLFSSDESSVTSSKMNTNSNTNSQSVTNTDSSNSDSNSVIENSNESRMNFQNNTHKITTVNGKMTVFKVVNGSVVFEEKPTTTVIPTTSSWVMPVLGLSNSTAKPKLISTLRTTQRPTRSTTRLTPRRTTRTTTTTTTLPPGIMEAMNLAVNR